MDYATKELAQQAADALNTKDPEFFCPLIDHTCQKECVCYCPALVMYRPGSQVNYYLSQPYCGNYMFFGGGI